LKEVPVGECSKTHARYQNFHQGRIMEAVRQSLNSVPVASFFRFLRVLYWFCLAAIYLFSS